ncbi:MAG: putative integral rane protein [Actinomycetia bacterium]|nr:putative integral rane protein [Actinomycetes bacterium]
MIALFRTELMKQFRRPRTYVALGTMVAVPIIITIALKLNPPGQGEGPDDLFFLSSSTGLIVPAASLVVMSRFLLIGVVSMFAGDAVASEASWGNLRALLTRPVKRGRLLAAKLSVVGLMTVLATALILISGLVAGVIAFGLHPLDIPFVNIHHSTGALLGDLVIAGVYVAWSLTGILTLGFMISTMTDSPGGAIGAAFGLYVTSAILDNITAIGPIRNVLPTHYFDAWTRLFTGHANTGDMWRGALLQIPYALIFGGMAWWWFRRKDILS